MKTVEVSEPFTTGDLKVDRCRQLIEFTKVCAYSRSRSFLGLGPRSYQYLLSQKPLENFQPIFYVMVDHMFSFYFDYL